VRVPTAQQIQRLDGLLAAQHPLGAGWPVGDYLREGVERDSKPVTRLVWGPARDALKDCDRWIAWSARQRGMCLA
jgi:hypothetical protein